jgi:MFS superfamily sulfate permease-like transporter
MKLAANEFDRGETAGAFGDLGTLVPFVVGYITIVGVDPQAVLLSFGVAAIATGLYFKTPMPVQPMKAIATAAITQAGVITAGMVWISTVLTAVLWLVLGLTGAVGLVAKLTRKPVVRGLSLGLGLAFIVEGARLMRDAPLLAAIGLAITLLLLAEPRIPAMVVLLVYGVGISLWSDAGLWQDLVAVRPGLRLPTPTWPTVSTPEVVHALFLLVLPQAALTVGNAVLATAEEHNRLFPEREVTVRELAFDHAALNAFGAAVGGVPMCRGAGGMAGHIRFGARTGGSLVILGTTLLILALVFSESVVLFFRLFPPAVLGVILLLGGLELAGAKGSHFEGWERMVMVLTAGLSMVNVGVGYAVGIVLYYACARGWVRLWEK